MKLAQALNLRKKLKADINASTSLLRTMSVRFPDDPEPEASCGEVVSKIIDLGKSLVTLVNNINATNSGTMLASDMSLAQALSRRAVVADLQSQLTSLLEIGTDRRLRATYNGRSGQQETIVATIMLDVVKSRQIVNSLAHEWRTLDDMIQEANWKTELVE